MNWKQKGRTRTKEKERKSWKSSFVYPEMKTPPQYPSEISDTQSQAVEFPVKGVLAD